MYDFKETDLENSYINLFENIFSFEDLNLSYLEYTSCFDKSIINDKDVYIKYMIFNQLLYNRKYNKNQTLKEYLELLNKRLNKKLVDIPIKDGNLLDYLNRFNLDTLYLLEF
jgi:hypothetical protein